MRTRPPRAAWLVPFVVLAAGLPTGLAQGQDARRQPAQPAQGQFAQPHLAQGQLVQGQPAQGQPVHARSASDIRAAQAMAPMPFAPLTPEHEKYLDQILKYWEHSSGKIQRYRCKFIRWEFDPVFGPKDTYKTYSEGVVQYAQPDKGMFKVTSHLVYTAPKAQGEKPTYAAPAGEHGEQWICDGQSVFEFDYPRKRLIERELPPEMRGQAIAEGPLPFLFGAEVEKMKARYWIRVVTPAEAKGEYWLEAYPKTAHDAASFKKVEVIIDEKDFLPKAMQVFARNWDPQRNPARTVFMFEQREVNSFIGNLNKLNIFMKEFYRPPTPQGWEKVVEKHQEPRTLPAARSQETRLESANRAPLNNGARNAPR